MKIGSIRNFINFKGATININALSDTHGHNERCDAAYQNMLQEDIFEKKEKGKQNYFIIGGDWFMSGDTKGYLTHPNKPLMWYQKEVLNKTIDKIKETNPNTEVVFVAGNHDLDGGIKLFCDTMKDFKGQIVISNLDCENSPAFDNLIKNKKLTNSKIDFIQDDTDDTKTHAVLNLGVAPVNLEYYTKSDGIKLVDNTKVGKAFVSNLHYRQTLNEIKNEINSFKEKYPTGIVILTSHTGAKFADACARECGIDIVFDAHEHEDEIRFVNNTPIVALSQNFEKIANVKIKLDNSGNKRGFEIKEIRPQYSKERKAGEIGQFYDELFKEDNKNIFTITCDNPKIKKLDTKNIRNQNNHLANFVCDAALEEIKEKDPSVQIFALNASAIRGGFKLKDTPSNSMCDVLNCLNGISKAQGNIYVNEVTGRELAYLIKDNFDFNKINPESNPLIHYSGITVDKTNFMKQSEEDPKLSELCKYITLEETGEVIEPDKTYKIANPEKYFIKSTDPKIKSMPDFAYSLDLNVRNLLPEYFKKHNEITVSAKERFY